MGMQESIIVCGREFRLEVVEQLKQLAGQRPEPSGNTLAREACALLAWYRPDGRPALASAKVALRKLQQRGLLALRPVRGKARHRLRASGQELPPLSGVPRRADQIQGLSLHLLSGQEDPRHGVWNDLIIAQHPCGDAPLVGAQLRYLVGSSQGWLGALGFGPAAFVLAARDQWIGWSTRARLGHLREVVGLSRLLIRNEVRCTNLVSKVLSLAVARLPEDWQARYGVRPQLVETYVDRSVFTGVSLSAANWLRVGASTGRGRLGPKRAVKSLKDIWVLPLERRARQKLQAELPPPLSPQPLVQSLAQANWCAYELAALDLGDQRRKQRAIQILAARWRQPQASFYGTFNSWAPAKAAYGLIDHRSPEISLARLLEPHGQATQQRMAAEPLVLLPQDTTGLNYTGLKQTRGLGPLGDEKGRGLGSIACWPSDPMGCPWASWRPGAGRDRKTPRRGAGATPSRLMKKKAFAGSKPSRRPQPRLGACPKRNWWCSRTGKGTSTNCTTPLRLGRTTSTRWSGRNTTANWTATRNCGPSWRTSRWARRARWNCRGVGASPCARPRCSYGGLRSPLRLPPSAARRVGRL